MRDAVREAAATAGDRIYQGNPCYRGHDGQRYTVSGACCACIREARANRRREIQDKLNAADAAKASAA